MNPDAAESVVVVAPVGQDASAMGLFLNGHGIPSEVCRGPAEAVAAIAPAGKAGALLMTEEVLGDPEIEALWNVFKEQPAWSDLPLIVLTTGGESRLTKLLETAAAAAGSITLLERPMNGNTLLRSVEVALKSRRRQYQVRDLLAKLSQSKEEADAAQREAEAATRAKDDFIAALSHELRTPLSPVLLNASEMENDIRLPQEARSKLGMIRRNIELEARLIDDLLELSRIRRGIVTVEPVSCDIHELLRRSQEIALSQFRDMAKVLEMDLAAREHHVRADPARLQQVFWNLMQNALKFTGSDGRVTVSTDNPAPGSIRVRVKDTGRGIAPEGLERIFSAFDQGDLTGRHQFGGLGLGLSISRAIVDAHAGKLLVLSEGLGKGTTFSVELGALVEAPQKVLEPGCSSQNNAIPLRLLLVEDHADTLAAVNALLTRSGHQVYPASSIAEALLAAEEHSCDLIISDLGLPDGTGLALMREIKRRHGIPGIAMSGYGMASDLTESKAAGFEAHLVKPVPFAMLRRAIDEIAMKLKSSPQPAPSAG